MNIKNNPEKVLRCTNSFGKPYFETLNSLSDLKGVVFLGNSIRDIRSVIEHRNCSAVERLSYFSTSGMTSNPISAAELDSVIFRNGLNLKSLSINYPFEKTLPSHVDLIKKVSSMHPDLKHLKIGLGTLKTVDLVTIFDGGNFAGLETLVIDNVDGELTIDQFKAFKHLSLKTFLICGCRISDDLVSYMKRIDWFRGMSRIGLHVANNITKHQCENIVEMLSGNIEEFWLTASWDANIKQYYLKAIENRLMSSELPLLTRLFVQCSVGDRIDLVHKAMTNASASLTLQLSSGAELDPVISRLIESDNVYVHNSNKYSGSNRRHSHKSLIHSEFAEELGLDAIETDDAGEGWLALAFVVILAIIVLLIKYSHGF